MFGMKTIKGHRLGWGVDEGRRPPSLAREYEARRSHDTDDTQVGP